MTLQLHAVLHSPYDPMAYPVSDDTIEVILRTARGDLEGADTVFSDRYAPFQHPKTRPMTLLFRDDLFDYWAAQMRIRYGRFSYYFRLKGVGYQGPCDAHPGQCDVMLYGEGGLARELPRREPSEWCFQYPYTWTHGMADNPPAWAQDAIVYQIFVDRFANGDPTNDPPGVDAWGAAPTRVSLSGGDFAGIQSKLSHLKSLGVTCVYLTPIFLSPSNHKYDTTDYYRIDPAFGDTDSARRLVDACHDRGIRVILDAVFNHTGYDFFAFRDVLAQGHSSPYFNWFNIHDTHVKSHPRPNYETFANDVWQMPKLRTDLPEVQDYFISIAEHWTRTLQIDGWRLDVANDVHPEFWRQFRRRIRAIKPDALIVGEIFHDAAAFLRGDQMDSVMNYPWRDACLRYFIDGAMGTDDFADRMGALQARYRRQVNYALWNLLGSHDKPRILTLCGGDARVLMLMSTFQFTYLGVPYIYYGDEIGMEGGDDPDCRRCMPWGKSHWNMDLLRHYQSLASLRRRYAALRKGECAILDADGADSPLVCARWYRDKCILTAINNAADDTIIGRRNISQASRSANALSSWAGKPLELLYSVGDQRYAVGHTLSLEDGIIIPPKSAAIFLARA